MCFFAVFSGSKALDATTAASQVWACVPHVYKDFSALYIPQQSQVDWIYYQFNVECNGVFLSLTGYMVASVTSIDNTVHVGIHNSDIIPVGNKYGKPLLRIASWVHKPKKSALVYSTYMQSLWSLLMLKKKELLYFVMG